MTETATPLLEARDVRRSFGGLRAVDGTSMTVEQGSITALIGPNGAGKTTFFNVVTGFAGCDAGSISFAGAEISRFSAHRIARLGLVRTFQLTRALAAMPVIDNMMLGAGSQPGESLANVILRPRKVRAREREVRAQALELLRVFHLVDLADAYAGTLSGGQRKLLEMARAMMATPRLLLLDEPMAGINPSLGLELLEHVERLRAEQGMTFLFIEHDMDAVMRHADKVIVMAEGRVILSAEPDVVAADERVIDAYLGGGESPTRGA